jgi:hypothetical protein
LRWGWLIGGSEMKLHIVVMVLCGAMLAPALAQNATPDNPAQAPRPPQTSPQQTARPGTIRVTTVAPEPEKWNSQAKANGTQRIFKCKPLACSDAQTVSFTFMKSPTPHPNPQALEKFAKEDLPKSIRAASASREIMSDGAEKIETVSSKTATLKGYPSVVNETKFSKGQSATYVQTAMIFAGPMLIRVQSLSPDEQLARTALDQFIEAMRIEEGPPAPPAPPAAPPRPAAKSQQDI